MMLTMRCLQRGFQRNDQHLGLMRGRAELRKTTTQEIAGRPKYLQARNTVLRFRRLIWVIEISRLNY
jgi:hypothetical protein